MKIKLIDTGFFYADGGAMFGSIPKSAWKRRYPSNENNSCLLSMRCALVTTPCGRIILIDNGVGYKQLQQLSYYNFGDLKDLKESIQEDGITSDQVTDIVLTHLHFDHCGYTTQRHPQTGTLALTFPHATCWVGARQWENFLSPHPLERDSYIADNILPAKEAGKLQLVNGPTQLCPGITLRLFDGHTPGQIVPSIKTGETTVVFAGDVIPLAACVSPEWISAYDMFPVYSYQSKIQLLEEAVLYKQILVFCHDAYTPAATVRKVNNFYKIDKKINTYDL